MENSKPKVIASEVIPTEPPSVIFARAPDTCANKDVAGIYSKTYFRIDKNGYDSTGRTDWDESTRSAYDDEVEKILTANGWDLHKSDNSSASHTATKGRNFLYLHPQSFSGVCENAEREKLLGAFQKAETFLCRAVDVYKEIHDMTDEQLYSKLKNKRDTIKAELLKAYTTKRRNLYISNTSQVEDIVSKRHSVKRLAIEGENSFHGVDRRTDDIVSAFVRDVFQSLIESGELVSSQTKNGIGYRAAN